MVEAVCVLPAKTSKSFVAGVEPFQLPGFVQFPLGVAPPFHVSVAPLSACAPPRHEPVIIIAASQAGSRSVLHRVFMFIQTGYGL